MNPRTLAWGVAFLAAGTAVASGWIGSSWSLGPRAGAASLLLVFGLVLLVGAFAGALRRRAEQAQGTAVCPVGATCACGHFNFKPRTTCRKCGAGTQYGAPSGPLP